MPASAVSAETRQRSEALTRLFHTLRAEAEQLRRCVGSTNSNNNSIGDATAAAAAVAIDGHEKTDKDNTISGNNNNSTRNAFTNTNASHHELLRGPSAAQQALALQSSRYASRAPATRSKAAPVRSSGLRASRASHRLRHSGKAHSARSAAQSSSAHSHTNTMSSNGGHESRKVALIAGRPLVLSPHSVRLPSVFTEQRQAMRAVEEKLVFVRDTLQRLGYNAGGRAHELRLPPVTAAAVEEAHRQFVEQLEFAHGPAQSATALASVSVPGRPKYAAGMNAKWGSAHTNNNNNTSKNKGSFVQRPQHTTYLAELEDAEDWATLVRRARVVAADEGNTETQSVADYADEPRLPSPTKYAWRNTKDNNEDDEEEKEEGNEGGKGARTSGDAAGRGSRKDTLTTTTTNSATAKEAKTHEDGERRRTTMTTTTNTNTNTYAGNTTNNNNNSNGAAMTTASLRMRYEVYAIRDAIDKIVACAAAMLQIEATQPSTAAPEQAWWTSALSLRDMKANAIRLNYHARAALRWSRRVREHLLLQAFAINHHAARSREELVQLQSHLREFTERTEQSVAAMNAILGECNELQDALLAVQERRVALQEEILQVGLAKGEFSWLHGNREEQEVLTAELAMLLRHGVRWPRSLHGAVQQVINWLASEPVCLE